MPDTATPEPLITDAHTPPQATAPADPWHVPPAPPIPMCDLAARYSPARGYATIAVPVDHIALGDVVDHTRGLVVVTEITRRHRTWTIGGYDPAVPYQVPDPGPAPWEQGPPVDLPLLTRNITRHRRVRVRRPATARLQLPGHTRLIMPLGDDAGQWTAGCSCGWTGPMTYTDRSWAEDAVGRHRAEVITTDTREQISSLPAIEQLETDLGDLLPWQWDHGTTAALHGLTTAQALTRLTPWADALDTVIEHISAHEVSTGEHWLWVEPPTWDGPALDIRAYPTEPAGG
jgi:hypothetical protein